MNFGVDAVRYSFIVMDLHHLLLAGLPAHSASPPKATNLLWYSERRCGQTRRLMRDTLSHDWPLLFHRNVDALCAIQ